LFQIGLFSTVEETHVSFQRKPSFLVAGVSSALFPVRSELVFERSPFASHRFEGGNRFCLIKTGLFSCVEEIHVSLQRKPSVKEAGVFSTFFPVRIDLVFVGNPSCKHRCQGGDMPSLLQKDLLSQVEKTHVSLQGQPSMLEEGATTIIFLFWI
jgi:hypothetical protein